MADHGCKDDEIATAHRVSTDAFPLCNERNLLAHGDWWNYDTKTGEIVVRGDRERAGEEQHRRFSAEILTGMADCLDDLEVSFGMSGEALSNDGRTATRATSKARRARSPMRFAAVFV